jgi:hypothetical protein
MIFVLPTLKDSMSFPSYPARLVAVSGTNGARSFFYEITMDVDIEKCISNDGLTIDIDILPKKPAPILERRPSKVGSARSFTRSTKTMERDLRREKNKRKENIIKSSKVDLTKYVSNSLAKLIKSRKQQTNTRLATGRKGQSLSASGVSAGRTLSATANPLASSQLVVGSSPLNSLLASQPVPTSIPQRSSVPLRKMSAAFLSAKKDPGQISKIPVMSLPIAIGQKVQSFRFTPPLKTTASPMYRVTTRKKTIKFRFVILEKRLKSFTTYYIQARLKNGKKVKLEEVGTIVQHSKLLNDYLTPVKEPILEASIISAGMISVGIKQVDDKAKSIRVFRRTAPAETGGSDAGSSWEEIIEAPLLSTDDELRFKDEFATSRTVIYRAIAIGENMRSTEDFGSAILLPIKKLKLDQTSALSAVGVIAENGRTVKITVSDIPIDAICIMVRRYDKTTSSYSGFQSGKNSGFVYVGTTPSEKSQYIVEDADASINFIDKTPKLGKQYRYVPVAIMKRGKEVIGTDALIEIPNSLDDDEKVEMSIPTPVVIVKNRVPSVSFNLEAVFTDFGFDEVRAALTAGRQDTLFDKDLFGERSNFSELINFLVERENFVTGEVESFGVIEAGGFEDNLDTQNEKNVSGLQTGVRYGYKITALLRSPESLFPKLASSQQDPTTLLTYQRAVGKFRNPLSLRNATLQSTARQFDIYAPSGLEPVDPFLAGRTNVQKRIEVNIPVPTRPGFAVTSENRGDNRLVRWTYHGMLHEIDHFQIFVCRDGGRQLLGVVHADSSSSNFMFRHFTKGHSVSYFYEVHAIQLNYKTKEKYKSAIIKPVQFDKKLKRGSRSSKNVARL